LYNHARTVLPQRLKQATVAIRVGRWRTVLKPDMAMGYAGTGLERFLRAFDLLLNRNRNGRIVGFLGYAAGDRNADDTRL